MSALIIATYINIMKKALLILFATGLSRSFLALAVILSMLIQTGYAQVGVPYPSLSKEVLFGKNPFGCKERTQLFAESAISFTLKHPALKMNR
jgi:hypothetical protein